MTIRAEFELQCLEYEGVIIIQEALLAGQRKSHEECQVVVLSGSVSVVRNAGLAVVLGQDDHF